MNLRIFECNQTGHDFSLSRPDSFVCRHCVRADFFCWSRQSEGLLRRARPSDTRCRSPLRVPPSRGKGLAPTLDLCSSVVPCRLPPPHSALKTASRTRDRPELRKSNRVEGTGEGAVILAFFRLLFALLRLPPYSAPVVISEFKLATLHGFNQQFRGCKIGGNRDVMNIAKSEHIADVGFVRFGCKGYTRKITRSSHCLQSGHRAAARLPDVPQDTCEPLNS